MLLIPASSDQSRRNFLDERSCARENATAHKRAVIVGTGGHNQRKTGHIRSGGGGIFGKDHAPLAAGLNWK